MAEFEGQTLTWGPSSAGPYGPIPPALEESEPLFPYYDIDRSFLTDLNHPNPPLIPLYGPQTNLGQPELDIDDFLDFLNSGVEDYNTIPEEYFNLDYLDVPPGQEYEYGYGHGPHGYGYGFGEGSGSGSGGSGGGSGSGSAKRDPSPQNKDNQGDGEAKTQRH